jgi:hypothetical protein
MEQPTDAERATFDTASAATVSLQQLGVLADNLFDFGFAIDPRATDAGNAMNVALALQTRFQGCGTVTTSGSMVTVDLPIAGCTGRSGTVLTGTITMTITRVGSDTVIATAFPTTSVDGYAISGMVSFSTASGSHFAASGTVTGGGVTITMGDRTIAYDGTGMWFSIDGGVSINNGTNTASATIAGASHTLGACYLHSGTTAITTAAGTQTVTFDAQTATTGAATLTNGDRTFALSLLAHGNCPAH